MKTRRITALLLAAAISVGLCACSSGSGSGESAPSGDSGQSVQSKEAADDKAAENTGGGVLLERRLLIFGWQERERLSMTRLSGNALTTTVQIIPVSPMN